MASDKQKDFITPIQRLREFVEWAIAEKLCSSERDFEKTCGLSERYIQRNMQNNKGNLSTETLGRIVTAFPHLNLVWLCTGIGSMTEDRDMEHARRFKMAMRRYRLNIDYKKAYELAIKQIEILNNIILKSK